MQHKKKKKKKKERQSKNKKAKREKQRKAGKKSRLILPFPPSLPLPRFLSFFSSFVFHVHRVVVFFEMSIAIKQLLYFFYLQSKGSSSQKKERKKSCPEMLRAAE
jgi:hypothetical protein